VRSLVFDYAQADREDEVLAAARWLRAHGAGRVVLVGASIGGRAVVTAAARGGRGRSTAS
jgi:dienelactone hydrolase